MVFPRGGSFVLVDASRRPTRWERTLYENLPLQYTEIFIAIKSENLQQKNVDIFLIFAKKIDCGYTLGGSNEYPQSMFWSKNKKNRNTPAYPSFAI